MQEQAGRAPHSIQNYRGWQSDVIVDLIRRYGFRTSPSIPVRASAGCTIRWSITAATSRP